MSVTRKIILSLAAIGCAALMRGAPTIEVFPSGSTVPENLLHLELHCSGNLQPPLATNQLKLVDARGTEIENPFLDLPLLSPDGRRIAVLFHPGRVKSGVGANLALGRALREGEIVTLVIEHPALAKPAHKTWRVTALDAESPQPSQWHFQAPRRATRDKLVVHLDAPISASAEALVAVRDPAGRPLAGSTRLEVGETTWCFVPSQPWLPGRYAVVTHPDLEDPAGNRPGARFETDGPVKPGAAVEIVLPFSPLP